MHLSFLRRLWRDRRGVAAMEFALSLGAVTTLGIYGTEMSNLALANLKVSQVALSLADNASRVGIKSGLAQTELRESDINDVLIGAYMLGKGINLTKNGRIVISSLQMNGDGGQNIKWQRCLGLKSGAGWDAPTDKRQGAGATGTGLAGLGPDGQQVTAPPNTAVIFVEINYDYVPVINFGLDTARKLTYVASMVVRDNRKLIDPTNPTPAASQMLCNKYTETVPRHG